MTTKNALIGSSGSVGIELKQLLENHPYFSKTTDFFEGLSKLGEIEWKNKIQEVLSGFDILILATGDEISKKIIQETKSFSGGIATILDCSSHFRVSPEFVFGLAEITSNQDILDAEFIANPGCHATGVILSLRPFSHLLNQSTPVFAHSLTGYSGGGQPMIEETKLGNLRTQSYSLIKTHKHIPEIKKFGLQNDVPISFTPTLSSNDFRGILTQVSFFVDEDIVPSDILNQAYQGKNGIEIVKKLPNNIDVSSGAHSHMVKLFSKKEGKIVTIYASYDNLLKGAAGSVVQILNIKNGFDEHLGLPLI